MTECLLDAYVLLAGSTGFRTAVVVPKVCISVLFLFELQGLEATGVTFSLHRATGNDEMCNFYIMFYTDSSVRNPYGECGGVQIPELVDHMPADSDVTLPPNPLLDEMAHGHHHHHHSMPSSSPTSPDQQPEPTGTLPGGRNEYYRVHIAVTL